MDCVSVAILATQVIAAPFDLENPRVHSYAWVMFPRIQFEYKLIIHKLNQNYNYPECMV